jgi:heptosyltransferase-2
VGRNAVSGALQRCLDWDMPLTQTFTFRRKLSLAVLNLFSIIARQRANADPSGDGPDESIARVLVVELWNIGDVILTMPFLAQLRCLFPRAKITLVARPFAADLLAGTGLVDDVIPAELTWGPADRARFSTKLSELWSVSAKLRQGRFNIAFASRVHIRERVLLALSGAKRTVGYALADNDASLTDPVKPGGEDLQKVDDWMRLLEPFGAPRTVHVPRLFLKDSERAWAHGYIASRGIAKDALVVGVHPGASLPEKRWPLDRFREVAIATAAQPGVRVLAFAEPSGFGSELFTIPGVVGAQVTLREMMALIERCGILVCNDSGPMHIAGALGIPTVAMFGLGIDHWFSPLGEGHEILRPEDALSGPATPEGQIREPKQIRSAQVLDAVGRAVQRLRGRTSFSRV